MLKRTGICIEFDVINFKKKFHSTLNFCFLAFSGFEVEVDPTTLQGQCLPWVFFQGDIFKTTKREREREREIVCLYVCVCVCVCVCLCVCVSVCVCLCLCVRRVRESERGREKLNSSYKFQGWNEFNGIAQILRVNFSLRDLKYCKKINFDLYILTKPLRLCTYYNNNVFSL